MKTKIRNGNDSVTLKVCEVFSGIQGESTYQGLPCSFIRLSGCNLRCAYCDTTYAYDEGYETSPGELISQVRNIGISLVEITGGEPLLQPDTGTLISSLLDEGFRVLVETNGSVSIAPFDRRAVYVMDFKAPSSKMDSFNDFTNVSDLKGHDEIKFVISDENDYEWTKEVCSRYGLYGICTVLLSPAFGIMDAETLVSWILRDKLKARLNVQIHKYIYRGERRGV